MIRDIQITKYEFVNQTCFGTNDIQQFHLFYIFDGKGILIVDSSHFPCYQNNLFLFDTMDLAVPIPDPIHGLTILHITFKSNSTKLTHELLKLPNQVTIDSQLCHSVFLEILHEYAVKSTFFVDIATLYLEQLLLSAITMSNRALFAFPTNVFPSESNDILLKTCTYIEEHLSEDISISTLCEICNYNPKQLNRLFQKEFKLSILEYVIKCRLKKARELLLFSNCSVTTIATATGFNSLHYFSNFFKEKIGVSPQEYRKNIGNAMNFVK